MASRSRWLAFGALGSLLILCVAIWAVLGPPSETTAPDLDLEPGPGAARPAEEKEESAQAATAPTTPTGEWTRA